MKSAIAVTLAAFAAAPFVKAQTESTPLLTNTPETSYVTEYYDDCPTTTAPAESVATGILGEEGNGTGTGLGRNETLTRLKNLTTYTTVYPEFCSTAPTIVLKICTIIEPCPSSNQPRPASYIPQGFTVTTATCAETSIIATLTTPVPATAGTGAVGAPSETPAAATRSPSAGGSVPPGQIAPAAGGAGAPGATAPGAGVAPSVGGSVPGETAPAAGCVPSAGEAVPPVSIAPAAGVAVPPGGSIPAGETVPVAGGLSSAGGSLPLPESAPAAGKSVPFIGVPASVPLFLTSQAFASAASSGNVNPKATSITPFTGAASTLSLGTSLVVGFFMMLCSLVHAL